VKVSKFTVTQLINSMYCYTFFIFHFISIYSSIEQELVRTLRGQMTQQSTDSIYLTQIFSYCSFSITPLSCSSPSSRLETSRACVNAVLEPLTASRNGFAIVQLNITDCQLKSFNTQTSNAL